MKNIITPTPAKKQWQKPDFYLLDTDSVNAPVKNKNNLFEHSATNKQVYNGRPIGKVGGTFRYIDVYLS